MVRASLGSHVGKPSSAYGWSGGFSPGFSGFHPPLMNDRLDISEIFLKGRKTQIKKKKKKKKKKKGVCVSHVEFNTCANSTKSSHRTNCKEQFHITLNGVKRDQML